MRTFGLIGFPLIHSFSEKYFTEKFATEEIADAEYINFPINHIEEIIEVFNIPGLSGLNVTIPYKEIVIPFLDELDETAKSVGAVNTIKIIPDKDGFATRTIGYNTDVFGFEQSLKPLLKMHHSKALVLGTGGSSRAVSFVLNKLGIDHLFVSRGKKNIPGTINYFEITKEIMDERTIIINCTPSGMFPKERFMPDIPYQYLSPQHLLFDLVYNPSETLFLKKGIEQGAQTKNGLEMLKLQAEKSWEIWMSPT